MEYICEECSQPKETELNALLCRIGDLIKKGKCAGYENHCSKCCEQYR
jgi:hypothetical protein